MTEEQKKIDDLTHALAKSNLQLLLAHELLGKIAERDLSLIGSTSIMRMEISNYFQDFKHYKNVGKSNYYVDSGIIKKWKNLKDENI